MKRAMASNVAGDSQHAVIYFPLDATYCRIDCRQEASQSIGHIYHVYSLRFLSILLRNLKQNKTRKH